MGRKIFVVKIPNNLCPPMLLYYFIYYRLSIALEGQRFEDLPGAYFSPPHFCVLWIFLQNLWAPFSVESVEVQK
ncbi:unnamed protein product [Meloidogyne enterolobii]|uniref:Uncharacterized protein n=1 Tax=Meloidogyne enterolobii TaxID=390850 RepID=A0ACB0Z145_MELEN